MNLTVYEQRLLINALIDDLRGILQAVEENMGAHKNTDKDYREMGDYQEKEYLEEYIKILNQCNIRLMFSDKGSTELKKKQEAVETMGETSKHSRKGEYSEEFSVQ